MEDEGKTYICDECGGTVHVGDFPFCHGDPSQHGPWQTADHPCEEFVDEMIADEPKRFSSTREWVRYMDKNNIVPRENKTDNHIRGGKTLFFDLKRS